MTTNPPASGTANPTTRVRRGSTNRQLRIRLDRNSEARIAAIRRFFENNISMGLSDSMAVRLALRVCADLCGGDPIETSDPQRLFNIIKAAQHHQSGSRPMSAMRMSDGTNMTGDDELDELKRLYLKKLFDIVQSEDPKAESLKLVGRYLEDHKDRMPRPAGAVNIDPSSLPFPSSGPQVTGNATEVQPETPGRDAALRELLTNLPFRAPLKTSG